MSWYWHTGKKTRQVQETEWPEVGADALPERVEHLRAWEERGRGYWVLPYAVALEPPFTPFVHLLPGDRSGRERYALDEPSPAVVPAGLGFLTLRLPTDQKVTLEATESFLRSLSRLPYPVTFEVGGDGEEIGYHLVAAAGEETEIAAQFHAHFPLGEARVEDEDPLRKRLGPLAGQEVGYLVVDFGLYHPFYQPLRRFSSFALDPLAGVIGALSHLSEGEVAGYQVLFSACRHDWAASIQRAVTDVEGQPFFVDGKEQVQQARQKIASPLYAVVLRVFAVSEAGDERAFHLCQQVGGALEILSEPDSNALMALSNEDYPDDVHFADVLQRQSHRTGMLLSCSELAGLAHPPGESLVHPKLSRLVKRETPLPAWLLGEKGMSLGLHRYRGKEQAVVWPDAFRTRHCYLLGATRMGKSTLLMNLIAQDLKNGRGLCVIDPHGDLAKDVLALVPEERRDEVYFLNFADRDYPVALNLLETIEEGERGLVCSDLLSILRRLFATSWGDRLEHILRFCLLTLLSAPGHTLRDIRRLLSEEAFREDVLENVTDPDLQAFWHYEFPDYAASTFAPIHNKLGLLLSNPTVRNIVAQKESRLDIAQAMAGKKVLVVSVSQGELGEDAAHLLGALLVSRLQIAAMRRLRQERAERVPFTLFVDEFQHFLVSSFERILSEAGKVQLSLVMANQFLGQLTPALQQAVLGNVGTLVCFQVGLDDARKLEKEFGGVFREEDLLNLRRGEAIVRMGAAQEAFNLATPPPPESVSEGNVAAILEQTRQRLCRSRGEVEAELMSEGRPGSLSGRVKITGKRGEARPLVSPNEQRRLEEPESFGLPE